MISSYLKTLAQSSVGFYTLYACYMPLECKNYPSPILRGQFEKKR